MNATQEARRKEMLDQILVMVTKMASDLEACNKAFRAAPPAFLADSDSSEREVDITIGIGYNSNNSFHGGFILATSRMGARAPAPVALSNPREKIHCRLVGKRELSRDVRLSRFSLPLSDQVLGVPIGKHIFIYANSTTSTVTPATSSPTSAPSQDADLGFHTGVTELLATAHRVLDASPLPGSLYSSVHSTILGTVNSFPCPYTIPGGRACHPYRGHRDCNPDFVTWDWQGV